MRLSPHRRILRGFSLLELVMVLAILTILASMAIPRLGGTITRHRVEAAAQRIAHDLKYLQRFARQTSAARTASFDLLTGAYTLVGLRDPVHPAAPFTVPLSQPPYEVMLAAVDFGGDADVTFDAYGAPDSGGSVVLSAGGYRAVLTMQAETGYIAIESSAVDDKVWVPAEGPVVK